MTPALLEYPVEATIARTMTITPWKFLIVALAGWMNRQQLILNESQNRRLATAALKPANRP